MTMLVISTAAATVAACGRVRRAVEQRGTAPAGRWGSRVRLEPVYNAGAAFGLPIRRRRLIAASALALGLVLADRRRDPMGRGLVLGGGASNLLERLRRGKVLDYVRFPRAPGRLGRSVFNLADFAILLGAARMLLCRRPRGRS